MVHRVEIFTNEERERIVDKIENLSDLYVNRMINGPILFKTLGIASYLDTYNSLYIQKSNSKLISNFDWMYDRIIKIIEKDIGPCCFHEDLPLPGFHIFERVSNEKSQDAKVHVDISYQKYKIFNTFSTVDFRNTLNFTVSLQLPKRGGGLNYWHKIDEDFFFEDQLNSPEFFAYKEGEMSYFFGNLIHQIAKVDSDIGEKRITLQGHGIKCNEKWILYF